MDHERLAGRVLMTGIPGTELDTETQAVLNELAPAGIVLFHRNYHDLEQLRALTRALHSLPFRPRIAIDHEGGRIVRVGAPFTPFPAARILGRTGDPDLTRQVGAAMGRELAAAGIDIDFAPVLDVDSNPDNPVIGDRAFAATAEAVIDYALPFLVGMSSAGVLPCGKHFPGHGDTDLDSHLALPVVHASRARLDTTELPPFAAAARAHLPLLMTAHVLYPALDPELPATLSRHVLTTLLRRQLGFRGVVISDDLEMKGIAATQPVPEAAVQALRAGVDWLLVCNDLQLSLRTARRVAEALSRGELDTTAVEASATRIELLPYCDPAATTVDLPSPEHVELAASARRLAATHPT